MSLYISSARKIPINHFKLSEHNQTLKLIFLYQWFDDDDDDVVDDDCGDGDDNDDDDDNNAEDQDILTV